MTGVTIPKEVYQQELEKLKAEYVMQFGQEAVSNEVQQFTRVQTIERYASAIRFWQKKTPEIYVGITTEDIARHAICSNSLSNMRISVQKLGIQNEVDAAVKLL